MDKRVNELIERYGLFQPKEKIVVAVSGGPDSVCLLHILHELGVHWSWSLVVAHLNHGFRGPAALADGEFVRRLSAELGWPAVIKQVDVPAWLKRHGGSPQDASRRLRYSFLREVAKSHGANSIALAHNLGDQAETVLLHLLRGAGTAGLAGMRFRESSGTVNLVRPLLTASRAEILRYLQHHRLPFRVDESNSEAKYTRNWLRHNLLPVMRQLNPEVEAAITRTAEVLQAETDFVEHEALLAYAEIAEAGEHTVALESHRLGRLPLALQRRVLRLAYAQLLGDDRDLSLSNVEAAIALLGRSAGTSLDWPKGLTCQLGYSHLQIGTVDHRNREGFSVQLPLPGRVTWADEEGEIIASIVPRAALSSFGDGKTLACLDRAALHTDVLEVRSWRDGDRFRPLGMNGFKKLQDFFIDSKVDRGARQNIPLVLSGQEIVWVAGLRGDHRFRVTPCTTEVVCLEYRKNKL